MQEGFELPLAKSPPAVNVSGVNVDSPTNEPADPWWVRLLIFIVPMVLALVSAKPYAGSWNDGSRLAAIESLGDRGTFAIDESVFVRVPEELIDQGTPPFNPTDPLLLRYGTLDKLFIAGHFYSDKPPVVSILLAGEYRLWRLAGGPSFAERPDIVVYWMTVFTSGLAYAVAVWCWAILARLRGWPRPIRLTLLLGFSLGSIAIPYIEYVNSHEMYLGVMSAIILQMERIRRAVATNGRVIGKLLVLGTLGGLGYNLDPGLAPGLALAVFGWVVYRVRRWHPTLLFVMATLPWVTAHHVLNHEIGGKWITPANAVPEYFNYPGSPFTETTITGFWRHTPQRFALYLVDLLFGKQGFLTHNLPLMLAVFCVPRMIWRRTLTAEQAAGLVFAGLGYLSYAILSKNHGGACCSVRWFVPFLAVGYLIIGDFLTWRPEHLRELKILTIGGILLAVFMWWVGPWTLRLIPGFWPIMGTTMVAFAISGLSSRRQPV
ncbi:hypothetical protein [Zavarzinella formosa]|uniref:hypothetical protein n=1 Tax=Zavarzinella formosa TaxID=360055 RepID=UPI0002E5F9F0|nr:hypothetical protein [Zavarzinella formosa]